MLLYKTFSSGALVEDCAGGKLKTLRNSVIVRQQTLEIFKSKIVQKHYAKKFSNKNLQL